MQLKFKAQKTNASVKYVGFIAYLEISQFFSVARSFYVEKGEQQNPR